MMADVISSRNSPKGWKRPFDEPIPLPRGRQLITLEDAARYIQKLPKAEQQIEEWQTAVETLILVAESNGGPTMLARAKASDVSEPTIARLESEDGPLGGRADTGEKLVAALRKAGVEFIAENGGGAGVRLKKKSGKPK
jgi:hypothetical protein